MQKNILEYKQFYGSIEYNNEDDIFYGKIIGINDLVTFESTSIKELKKSFKEAADDLIEICKQKNKITLGTLKGKIQVPDDFTETLCNFNE